MFLAAFSSLLLINSSGMLWMVLPLSLSLSFPFVLNPVWGLGSLLSPNDVLYSSGLWINWKKKLDRNSYGLTVLWDWAVYFSDCIIRSETWEGRSWKRNNLYDRDNVKDTQGKYSELERDPRMPCPKEYLGSRVGWCSREGWESRPLSMNLNRD